MRSSVLFLMIGVLGSAQAGTETDPARAILEEAIHAQGDLDRDEIRDVRIVFTGTWKEEGRHAIRREYLYRSADRSFAVSTRAKAASAEVSERGVLGGNRYWELASNGDRLTLSRINRNDRAVIRTIEDERKKFEHMLEAVFLARLGNGGADVSLGAPEPVRLLADQPREARSILGTEEQRKERTYHVLDIRREGEARLRLYISTNDYTVRKAVTYHHDQPERPEWVYYFGPYRTLRGTDLLVPLFLSVHSEEPVDERSGEEGSRAWGQLEIHFNEGLPDELFAAQAAPPRREDRRAVGLPADRR